MSVNDGTVYLGRKKLLTDYVPHSMVQDGSLEISVDTIPTIMKNIWALQMSNRSQISYLMEYYKGNQDILYRVKTIRPDIDNKVVFNHAMSITRDIVGYTFGKPICYVHRKEGAREAVKELSEMVEAEDKFTSDQEIAQYASICGTAFRGIFADIYGVEDEVPFSIVTLDPRNTFVVYSSQVGNPPVLACTYYEIEPTVFGIGKFAYLVYTRDKIYRYEASGVGLGVLEPSMIKDEQDNPMGLIPIIEYPNNMWRMGDWEMAKTLLDAINLVGSDCINDLEGAVSSILVGINIDLTDTKQEAFKARNIISYGSMKDAPADLKYLANPANPESMEALRTYLLEQMRIIVGMPTQDTGSSSGGDTGDAVYLRNGYERLEVIARMKETFFKRSERATLRLILKILEIEKQGLGITVRDITVKFSRSMTDNLSAKASALSVLQATKILTPTDSLEAVGITTEPDELARKGEEYWKAHDEEVAKMEQTKTVAPTAEKPKAVNDPAMKQKVDRK